MAKTTSQIVAENKKKRAEEQKIDAVAKKHIADAAKRHEQTGRYDVAKKLRKEAGISTAQDRREDMQRKKELAIEKKQAASTSTSRQDPLKIQKDAKAKAEDRLKTHEDTDIDWTDAAARQKHEQEQAHRQAAVDQAGKALAKAESEQAVKSAQDSLGALSPEEDAALNEYIMERENHHLSTINPMMENPFGPLYSEQTRALLDKYGKTAVDAMASVRSREDTAEVTKAMEDYGREQAEKGGLHAAAASLLTIPAQAMASPAFYIDAAVNAANGRNPVGGIDPNFMGNVLNRYTDSVRGTVAKGLAEKGLAGKAGSWLYQAAMSVFDNAERALYGPVGGAVLAATQSFSRTLSDATEQGATPAQAALLATTNAGIEYLTEKIPLDDLISVAKGTNAGAIIKNLLRNAGIEAATEELSLLGTVLAEAAILRENSAYQQEIQGMIDGGMSPEEAKEEANRGFIDEAINTMIVSGLAGGVGGLGASLRGQQVQADADYQAMQQAQEAETESHAQSAGQEEIPVQEAAQSTAEPVPGPVEAMAAAVVQNRPQTEQVQQNPSEDLVNRAVAGMFGGAGSESTAINTDPARHTPEEQATINDYQNSVDENLVEYVEAVRNNPGKKMPKYPLKNVGNRAAQDIKRITGVDVSGNKTMLEPRIVEHILKRHGKDGNADNSMRDVNDIGRIQYVIDNYDSMEDGGRVRAYVTPGKNGKDVPAQSVVIKKKINGTYFVVEAVPDTKRKTIYITSAYMSKDGKAETAPSLSVDAGAPHVTPDSVAKSDAVSNNSIPESVAQVNGNYNFEHLGRANAAIAELRQSDEYKAMSRNQRVQAINEIMDYFTRVVDENESGTAAESNYYDEFEDWGADPNRDGVGNPLADRNFSEVGKRSTKAYMYENPAVKHFYQEQAAWMLSELADSTRGERTYNDQVYYESGGEKGWSGTKRHTSESIAELLDQYGMTYEQIERGLNAIINDSGQENNAASKRIEFVINDRLMNGYTDFYSGERVPGNAEYLNLLRSQQQAEDSGQPIPEGMKGTGAAEQNFSGKAAYNATLSAENAQADRKGDVRPMELPKQDIHGGNVSAVTGNVYGSAITPDEFASLMEDPTAKGDFSYIRISNDKATQLAEKTISSAGTWENAFDQWKRNVEAGAAGAEMSARGALLLNRAAQSGDKRQWLETLHYMQMLGTNTAQGLQAMNLVRTLNRQDKAAYTQMTVYNFAADMQRKGVELDLSKTNADLEEMATTTDAAKMDALLENIQQNLADQIPATLMDQWNALRYLNMLGNLKTQVRNVGGNLSMKLNYMLKDKIAASLEWLVYHISGKKFERTKSLHIDSKLKRAAAADFEKVADIVGDGGKYGDQLSGKDSFSRGVQEKRTIFQSGNKIIDAFLKPVEAYRKATNWAMNNERFGDAAFGRSAYANALAGYLQAHGVKGADLSKVDASLMDKARAYAVQEAQEATFHDNSVFARVMSKLQKDSGAFGQALIPFVKTPANVATRGIEFSPLGMLNTAIKAAKKTAAGSDKLTEKSGKLGDFARSGAEITGADIINSLSKNLTGTGLFVLGCALRNAGLLSGGPDEDKEKDGYDSMNGEQNYAFLLPDGGSYTLDWLNPTAVPLFMGANLWDIVSEKSDLTFADLEQVFTAIAEPMLEMSMLQGVSDALDSVKYSDNNIVQLGLNAAVNYLSQGLTNTLLGQLEKSTEEKRMTTYVDKDSQVPVWAQKALGKASQKIPGWDYQQVPYINARGEEEKQPAGVEGLLYNTLSPGYYKEGYSDDVTKELNRLYETPEGDGSILPAAPSTTVSYTDTSGNVHKEYHMTPEESETLRNTYGQTYNQVLGELVKSKDYQALSNRLKVNAAQLAQEYATERGKAAALADYPQATDWTAGIEGREAEAIVRKVTTSALNDAISAVFTRTKNGWDTKEAESGMEKVYTEYESLSRSAKADILDDATTETRRYLEARTAGISQERYLSAAKEIATAKPAQGEDTVTQIRRMELLADEPLSPRQKETLMKMYASEKQQQVIDKVEQIGEDAGWTAGQYLEIYASAYRLHEDYTHGRGKKSRTIQKYMKEYDMDWATASALYKCFS